MRTLWGCLKLIAVTVFLLIAVFYYFVKCEATVVEATKIRFEKPRETLYFVEKTWARDGIVLMIATNGNGCVNEKRKYVIGDEFFFYKTSNDTLYVYTRYLLDAPEKFNSKVKVVSKEYSLDDYFYFRENLKELELSVFP